MPKWSKMPLESRCLKLTFWGALNGQSKSIFVILKISSVFETCYAVFFVKYPFLTSSKSMTIECENDEFESGSSCAFSCPEPFRVNGTETITCNAGRWDFIAPSCCMGMYKMSSLVRLPVSVFWNNAPCSEYEWKVSAPRSNLYVHWSVLQGTGLCFSRC